MHSSPIVLLSSLAMPSHFLKRCCVSLRLIVKLACFTLVVSNYVDFHAHHWCAADMLLSVTAPCQWWREKIPFSLIAAWHSSDSYNEKGPMIPQPSVNNMPDLFWRKLPVGREWIWVMWGRGGWREGGVGKEVQLVERFTSSFQKDSKLCWEIYRKKHIFYPSLSVLLILATQTAF